MILEVFLFLVVLARDEFAPLFYWLQILLPERLTKGCALILAFILPIVIAIDVAFNFFNSIVAAILGGLIYFFLTVKLFLWSWRKIS